MPNFEIFNKRGWRKDGWEFMFTLVSFWLGLVSGSSMCHRPPHPRKIGVMNMGKSGVPTTVVWEWRADLLAKQVTLHGPLLCIEQPRSSTVSVHHPASPHSLLHLTRLNALWMAAECRNLRAACKEGNFLLMVAHQAPKHFSQGEALGCNSLTNWNRYNEDRRWIQLHQSMSDGPKTLASKSGVFLLILSRFCQSYFQLVMGFTCSTWFDCLLSPLH